MPSRFYKFLLFSGIIITLTIITFFWVFYSSPKNLEVDFLDVGQGDSELIKTPFGQNILIDGGPDNTVIKKLSKNLAWWDRKIDLMILTHPHDDHVTGLTDVLKRYDVDKILYTGVSYDAPNYKTWLAAIQDRGISPTIIDRPQIINFGQECNLNILYPVKSLAGKATDNLNNSSIVSLLDCAGKKFLFTGDAETEEETELIKNNIGLRADVLKVGHHGSDTSSGEEFLQLVRPEIAVIEVGANNDFGHPNLRILKKLERAGAQIYRTDLDGTIMVSVLNNEFEVKTD